MLNWIPNYISSVPLHLQLAQIIGKKVGKDGFCEGDILPDAPTVSARCKISKSVVYAAYHQLRLQGIVKTTGNKEQFVVATSRRASRCLQAV